MKQALSEEALRYACQRVEDFALVNKVRPNDERAEATDLWLDHLGLEEPLRAQFAEWLDRFLGSGWEGAVLIGFAVGLLVNQFYADHPDLR